MIAVELVQVLSRQRTRLRPGWCGIGKRFTAHGVSVRRCSYLIASRSG